MEADSNLYGLIRHFGTLIGTLLASKGYIENGSIETFGGLVVVAASVLWSLYNKKQTSKAIDAALDLPSGSSREALKAAVATKTDDPPKQL